MLLLCVGWSALYRTCLCRTLWLITMGGVCGASRGVEGHRHSSSLMGSAHECTRFCTKCVAVYTAALLLWGSVRATCVCSATTVLPVLPCHFAAVLLRLTYCILLAGKPKLQPAHRLLSRSDLIVLLFVLFAAALPPCPPCRLTNCICRISRLMNHCFGKPQS
jgi:hypothetical protein